MTDDPFLTLLVETLNLMHPRFAAVHPLHEFYHQFRRLWDKALPVRLGLGHIIIQNDPDAPPGPRPDLLVWQLEPERRLGAVSAIECTEHVAVLARYKKGLEYPYAVGIVIGSHDVPMLEGVTRIVYDTERRTASIYQPHV